VKPINNRTNHFERSKGDKISGLGLGKIQTIKNWLEEHSVTNYIIDENLVIHCTESVKIINAELIDLPLYINFGNISGSFSVRGNNLTTLRGCPKKIARDFSCTNNKLTTLDFMPTYIGGDFHCALNFISNENLKKYLQSEIKGYVHFNHQYVIETTKIEESNHVKFERNVDKLASIGAGKIILIKKWLEKQKINRYTINDDLSIDVENGIEILYSDSNSSNNQLPTYIQFRNVFGNCNFTSFRLVSLKGSPKYVDGFFSCSVNLLKSLDYAPENIEGDFYCYDNDFSEVEIDKYLNSGKTCENFIVK